MQPTYLYFKEATSDTAITAEVASLLQGGEQVLAAEIQQLSPTTTTPLEATIQSYSNQQVTLDLTQGTAGCSYGIDVSIRTNQRVFTVLLAVNCNTASSQLIPYESFNPNAFKDLVGELQAGDSAVGTAVFTFPTDIDVSGGYVLWELLGESGTVFSAGNAFDYRVEYTGFANTVKARSIISVPTDIPETLENQSYQVRYTLVAGDVNSFQFENITVVGVSSVPQGTQSVVEFQGEPAMMELVTPELFDRVVLELYYDNQKLSTGIISDTSKPMEAPAPERTASGWFYRAIVETQDLKVSLRPYTAIWKYWNSDYPARVYTERADFWVVNPSLMSAADDVKAKINKARTTLYGAPDLLFPYETIMTWLRRGGDAFNGYAGVFTNFTFINALGGIREYWLLFAELFALESQYLAEGEKSFDFQGAAISLNVDRTQFLDSAASKIQGRLDSEFKPFKQNLVIRGNTGGDGSGAGGTGNLVASMSPLGAVGILISPASVYGLYHRGPYAPRGLSVETSATPQVPNDGSLSLNFSTEESILLEIGQELVTPLFNAAYSRTPREVFLRDSQGGSKRVNGSQFCADGTYTRSDVGTVDFTLTASASGASASATLNFQWAYRLYFGTGVEGSSDEVFIKSLQSVLSPIRKAEVQIMNSTERAFIVVPASMGQPVFTVNGVVGGFALLSLTEVTTFGIGTVYAVYQSIDVIESAAITIR